MIEIIAVIFTLISVWLTRKENIWCWPIGIIGIVFYMILFMGDKSWANFALQALFIIQSIHGWINWSRVDKYVIKKTSMYDLTLYVAIATLIELILPHILPKPINALDIATTSLSIVGIYLLAIKHLEAWIFWGVADILYIMFFISTGHIVSSILYAIFLVNAILAFI